MPLRWDEDFFGHVDVRLRPTRSGAHRQLDGREVTMVSYNVSPPGATGYVLVSPLDEKAAVAPVDRWLRRGLPAAIPFVAVVAWWARTKRMRNRW